MRILGVDFTCAPSTRKRISVACGVLTRKVFEVETLEHLTTFAEFELLLRRPGPWIGGFDFPFGLPSELVRDLGWPRRWRALVELCGNLTRGEFRGILDGYRATRPAGRKYAHRRTDLPAGSSSPMKLVNPPVALMFHEGAPRLADAGVHIPGLCDGDRMRVALEAYPGLLARSITRSPYKNDTPSKQTPARAAARDAIVSALARGRHALRLGVFMGPGVEGELRADATGDSLDAVICAVQGAWAAGRRNYGLPARVPRAEGWIVSA